MVAVILITNMSGNSFRFLVIKAATSRFRPFVGLVPSLVVNVLGQHAFYGLVGGRQQGSGSTWASAP